MNSLKATQQKIEARRIVQRQINTYKFADYTSEAQRDAVVLVIRKEGLYASREVNTLWTDASIVEIGLAYGTTSVIEVV